VLFLTIEGVRLATKGYADGIRKEGFKPLKEIMDAFIENGGQIWACAACTNPRGITEQDMIEGATIKTATTASVDARELESRVQKMYRQVAEDPHGDFHFEMGRAMAERLGYEPDDLDSIPADAIDSFAGVGYYFDLAALQSGERVLDLGSGSGMDSFIAALKVGADGSVVGVDMTDAQRLKAERLRNDRDDFSNVEFLRGYIERLPIPDGAFDVVISNGVINLAADKRSVFDEAARVLRPGGRLAIADIVTEVQLPADVTCNATLWVACIGGASQQDLYRSVIESAGFRVVTMRENPEYHFLSKSAKGATEKWGVKSVSLLAIKHAESAGVSSESEHHAVVQRECLGALIRHAKTGVRIVDRLQSELLRSEADADSDAVLEVHRAAELVRLDARADEHAEADAAFDVRTDARSRELVERDGSQREAVIVGVTAAEPPGVAAVEVAGEAAAAPAGVSDASQVEACADAQRPARFAGRAGGGCEEESLCGYRSDRNSERCDRCAKRSIHDGHLRGMPVAAERMQRSGIHECVLHLEHIPASNACLETCFDRDVKIAAILWRRGLPEMLLGEADGFDVLRARANVRGRTVRPDE
jgi:ubiquinone/menaquinone biosynthesis C-methylase UbiE